MKRRITKVFRKYINESTSTKVAHFAITYGIVYTLADKWDINGAIAVGILVGVVKEIWDKLSDGKLSVGDLVADVLGIAIAFFIFII